MMKFIDFTKIYSIQKTLKFELKPIGKTLEHIHVKGLITQDEQRAVSYQSMKKTIDEYHKWFIDKALTNAVITQLDDYAQLYRTPLQSRDEAYKKSLIAMQANLRKDIVKAFASDSVKAEFQDLFKAELIKERLYDWMKSQSNEELVFDESFKNFTTYFVGFHENRKNMYSAEEHSTAIAYRLIHENLPKFLDNLKILNDIISNAPELYQTLAQVENELIEQYSSVLGDKWDLAEIFQLEHYNQLLTQKAIERFNTLIGGRTTEQGEKIQGLNEYINLYNQKQTDKSKRFPKFKQLYKQILSDRSSASFLPEKFKSDDELLNAVHDFYHANILNFEEGEYTANILEKIKQLLDRLNEFDLEKIYLKNDGALTTLSQRLFGSFNFIAQAMNHYYMTVVNPAFEMKYQKAKSETARDKLDKEKERFTKGVLSISQVQNALEGYVAGLDKEDEIQKTLSRTSILDYFKNYFTITDEESGKTFGLIDNIQAKYSCIKGLLNSEHSEQGKLIQNKAHVANIKAFLDSLMEVLHFIKVLNVDTREMSEKDELFYTEFSHWYAPLALLIPLYNKVRDYCTQKPYSVEKIKLNFENPQLLGGWDANKETDYRTVILRFDGIYYLAVLDKKNNKVLLNLPTPKKEETVWEKMVYSYMKSVATTVPKCSTQLKAVKQYFAEGNVSPYILDSDGFNSPLLISKEIFELNNLAYNPNTKAFCNVGDDDTKCYKKFQKEYARTTNDFEGHRQALNLWCKFCIEFLKKYKSTAKYDWHFQDVNVYQGLDEFYKEIDNIAYKIEFSAISEQALLRLVDEGKIYLFQLYNKDFSIYSKGKPNLHTMYWKALFDPQNLADVVYKLNGEAEMFYRKASIAMDKATVHPAHEALKAKNPNLKGKISTFEYDIIKDKRFTEDKFQFHVPITLNFKGTATNNINAMTNEYIAQQDEVKVIGLDRGERHLIYLCLVDGHGNIIKQESLNTIVAENHPIETPYHTLLDEREKARDQARKEWGTIETIKELKEGYLSQVVHKIATMMVEHQAIVVMEDLNFGFKRGRFHVEKQVYQKLEKMLIDKLNYLVFKEKSATEAGGILNALQLTSKFESFKKLGKQSGFLYYVPAWNTSKIDPATGFVDFLKPKYESLKQAQEFFGKFTSIKYNESQDYFEFEFDYNQFTTKAEGTRTQWTVCTHGETRYGYNRTLNQGKGGTESIYVTQEIKKLLKAQGIEYPANTDIKSALAQQKDTGFYKTLCKLLSVTLALRYSNKDTNEDFILSPIANEQGIFFDSRIAPPSQPADADANGAYHIALKGLWAVQQIKQVEDLRKVKFNISNKQWLSFAQNKAYRK